MNMIKDTMYDIQEDIIAGELTFRQIAEKHGVHFDDVDVIANELNDMIEGEREVDMRDYDAEALASAGWGTDEDYCYFDDY